MKKLLLLFMAFLFTTTYAQKKSDFYGKWKGKDEKEGIGYFKFTKDGFAYMLMNGQEKGGPSYQNGETTESLTYKVNLKKKSGELQLIFTDTETEESYIISFLLRFLNKNEIKVASNFSEEKPTDFTDDNSFILKKVEE
ncbi:hypothetical protein [Aureivirga marina]|uniref:hypothetical protein n=1 Tax=Aureivirga marina TaxID=1182451 RepID=UPI0018CA6C2B|nr:hypothetical protein [Aureivirga marina]